MFFIQYDESGNINAAIQSQNPPDCARQLAFDSYVETGGKRVDTATGALIDDPALL